MSSKFLAGFLAGFGKETGKWAAELLRLRLEQWQVRRASCQASHPRPWGKSSCRMPRGHPGPHEDLEGLTWQS